MGLKPILHAREGGEENLQGGKGRPHSLASTVPYRERGRQCSKVNGGSPRGKHSLTRIHGALEDEKVDKNGVPETRKKSPWQKPGLNRGRVRSPKTGGGSRCDQKVCSSQLTAGGSMKRDISAGMGGRPLGPRGRRVPEADPVWEPGH